MFLDFLVLSPPVVIPSEPASGGFLLAAGLRARGIDAAFADLSLMFFQKVFESIPEERGSPPVGTALNYFRESVLYEPHRHRTCSGILNAALQRYSRRYPGWRLSLMDAEPPCELHSPSELASFLAATGETPFTDLWHDTLDRILRETKPKRVLISISYLSQLPAAVDLHLHLRSLGIRPITGGSLSRSLVHSGMGYELLEDVFGEILTCDGSTLAGDGKPFLSELVWPEIVSDWDYVSSRPVIPFTLSTGCYWNRCLFCPDRGSSFYRIPEKTFSRFIGTVPDSVLRRKPLIHFLDSAIPPESLKSVLPDIRNIAASFYGFVRPTSELFKDDLLSHLSKSGCLMLQLGVESGSSGLLETFDKGIDPALSLEVLRRSTDKGMRTYAYLLLGLPGETEQDRSQTKEFLEQVGDSIDFLNLAIFNLPRNCELAERADEFGMEISDFDASANAIRLYSPFTCNGSSPRERAREFIRKELSELESVNRALQQTPKWFRGSHMAMTALPGRIDG